MTNPEDFMRRAIAISRDQMQAEGAAPFGAVIVKDGEIVGEGVNQVVAKSDPTSHGEVDAIRDAGRRLATWDLSGCDLYTTCEPCEMCLSAMFWAKIRKLYYANTLADCEAIGFNLSPLRSLVRGDLEQRSLPEERVLAAEAHEVLEEWTRLPTFKPFQ